jgi:type IX secretion system PorP/SprF family membrane protein
MKRHTFPTVLWVLSLILPALNVSGQDPNFSQFFNAPVYYNPAFTGLNTGLRARFTFRDQWANLPVDFKSYFFAADLGDRNFPGSGGLGLVINSNNEGLGFIKDLSVGLTAGVRIPLSDNMVTQVGIKASFIQKSLNWDDFVFTDQFSEKYGNIYQTGFQQPDINTKTLPDFAAGGLIQFSNTSSTMNGTMGVALDHMFQPDQSFLSIQKSPLPRKLVVHGDFIITTGSGYGTNYSSSLRGAGDPLKLNPGFLYQNQYGMNSFQIGTNLLKYNIYIGAWYKNSMQPNNSTALSLLAGYRYFFGEDMSVKFMYSYDLQMSGSLQGAGGTHEISVVLEFSKLSIFGRDASYSPRATNKKYSPIECSSF